MKPPMNTFNLICMFGYKDPCLSEPCVNGGSCLADKEKGTFVCHCPDEIYGTFCEERRYHNIAHP